MNNKGQVLVLMVIIIPIILLILGFVIDYGIVISEKNKLYSIGNIAIEEYKEKSININETIFKNDKDIKVISFNENNNELTLTIEKKVNTIFSSIIGVKNYNVRIKVRG